MAKQKTGVRPPPKISLCIAEYQAEQAQGIVTLCARGEHFTSGFTVFFEESPLTVFPPEFSLWHAEPTGIVLQVITPFSVCTSFRAAKTIKSVTVHDANGKHNVPVRQIAKRKARKAAKKRPPAVRARAALAEAAPCLDGLMAGEILLDVVGSALFDLEKRLGLIYASPNGRIEFRERTYQKVLAVSCDIDREDIPNGEDNTLREVRDAMVAAAH